MILWLQNSKTKCSYANVTYGHVHFQEKDSLLFFQTAKHSVIIGLKIKFQNYHTKFKFILKTFWQDFNIIQTGSHAVSTFLITFWCPKMGKCTQDWYHVKLSSQIRLLCFSGVSRSKRNVNLPILKIDVLFSILYFLFYYRMYNEAH